MLIYSQDLPTSQDFPICTYPVHPHGPTPYGRRCFSCMFLFRSSFLNSIVSLVCTYTIPSYFYDVNSFFTTFDIFIIHNLLTEMRLTFSIFREPYFIRVSSYYNAIFDVKKREDRHDPLLILIISIFHTLLGYSIYTPFSFFLHTIFTPFWCHKMPQYTILHHFPPYPEIPIFRR